MSAVAESSRAPITVAISAATLMGALDATIANVALPHMQGNLSASPEQITWVLTSYIVATAVTTPITGWLAGRIGLKRMMLIGIGGFTVVSVLCGLATSLPEMVLFRILQGMFSAPIVPLSQAVLLNINPPERHARAMALWSTTTILGPVLGPVLGGFITEDFSWRWCFYINLPVGAAALLLLWVFLPSDTAAQRRRFDFLGFGSLTIAIAAFQLMLDRGPSQDWFATREIWIYAILAAIGFWIFIAHSLTAEHPLFDPSLARDRNLMTAALFGFFISVLMFSSLTLLPLLMQGVLGYPVTLAGLISMPRGLVMMIIMLAMGRLTGLDPRLVLATGLMICIVAFWQMTQFDLTMSANHVMVTSMLQGLGQGMIFVTLSILGFATVDPLLRADASAIYNLLRNIGGSIGIALMQGLSASSGQQMHAALAAGITSGDPVVRAGLPPALSPDTVAGAMALDAEINRQAVMVAYLNDFRVMVVMAVLLMPLLLFLRPPKRRREARAA